MACTLTGLFLSSHEKCATISRFLWVSSLLTCRTTFESNVRPGLMLSMAFFTSSVRCASIRLRASRNFSVALSTALTAGAVLDTRDALSAFDSAVAFVFLSKAIVEFFSGAMFMRISCVIVKSTIKFYLACRMLYTVLLQDGNSGSS